MPDAPPVVVAPPLQVQPRPFGLWWTLGALAVLLLGASVYAGFMMAASLAEARAVEQVHLALETLSRMTVVLLDVQQKLPALRPQQIEETGDIEGALDKIKDTEAGLFTVEQNSPPDRPKVQALRAALGDVLHTLEDRHSALVMDDDEALSDALSRETDALNPALRMIEEIEVNQRHLGIEGETALRGSNDRLAAALSVAGVLAVALQLVIWLLVRVYRRRRALVEEALRTSNMGLEATVAQSAASLAQANHELAVLSGRLLALQEQERRRIALELHDQVGQQLAMLLLNLRVTQTEDEEAGDTARARRMRDMATALQTTYEQIHDLALELRPSMLDQLGLVPTLEWFAREQAMRTECRITVGAETLPGRVPPEIATASFRIVQEAVNNALKHAQPRNIDVLVYHRDGCLDLCVRDDGKGFDPGASRANARYGLGLLGMRERAVLVGGRFSIQSRLGAGTEVNAWLPLSDGGDVPVPDEVRG